MTLREYFEKTRSAGQKNQCECCGETMYWMHSGDWIDGDGCRHFGLGNKEYANGYNDAIQEVGVLFGPGETMTKIMNKRIKVACRKEPI